MNTAARIVAAGAILCVLAGCPSFGTQDPQRFYVLDGTANQGVTAHVTRATTLLVAPTTASSFYETQDIAYSRAPGVRAYYQFHRWAERPGRRVTELLIARIERDDSFKTVVAATSGVHGNFLLDTHISEFYHDATSSPGVVRVTMSAELMDPVQRSLLARRTFDRSAPAATYDAAGAVAAFNEAVSAILNDVAMWVDSAAPR